MLRAAGFKLLSDYEQAKYSITAQRLDDILLQADRNVDHYQATPEWMRPGGATTFIVRVHMGNEQAEFHKNRDQKILQASLKATEAVLQQMGQIHSYLDTVQTAYYYHVAARLVYTQGDYPKANDYGQLACYQYIQNSMYQRALQVAGQLRSSELEQQVMLAIKAE